MYEIIIIICLATILGILLRKWPKTYSLPLIKKEASSPPELEKEDLFLLLKQAEKFFRQKDYQKAEETYLKAALIDPQRAEVYGRLGVIYLSLGNFEDAKEALSQAVKMDPQNGFYQNNLGLALYHLDYFKQARFRFEKALLIDDKIAKRHLNLGLCLEKLREYKRALEAYKKALELEPKNKKYQKLLEEAHVRYKGAKRLKKR